MVLRVSLSRVRVLMDFGWDWRQKLDVGVGCLAGSTIMMLTVPWALSILAGRVRIVDGEADYEGESRRQKSNLGKKSPEKQGPPPLWPLTGSGVSMSAEVRRGSVLMLLTCPVQPPHHHHHHHHLAGRPRSVPRTPPRARCRPSVERLTRVLWGADSRVALSLQGYLLLQIPAIMAQTQPPAVSQFIEPHENATDPVEIQQILAKQHPFARIGMYLCFSSFFIYCGYTYFFPDVEFSQAKEDGEALLRNPPPSRGRWPEAFAVAKVKAHALVDGTMSPMGEPRRSDSKKSCPPPPPSSSRSPPISVARTRPPS